MAKRFENRRTAFIFVSAVALVLLVVALLVFAIQNSKRIASENRDYLVDNAQMVADSIDAALSDGYNNIKILSDLVSRSLTGPEFDIASLQGLIKNSVFDFMEFADRDGMDHNITGGVSDARDRQYYLDAKAGNTGMELIYVSRATHETLLMFYSPISYQGEFVGSLVGVYQASNRITKLLSSEYFGEPAVSYLATGSGRILASNQGFDPQNEMYISDLAEGDKSLEQVLKPENIGSDAVTFSLTGNATGGCIVRLSKNGGYLIQIFPTEASRWMISRSNALSYGLAIFLMLLYIAILVAMSQFYRQQQKQVEEAKNQAEEANKAKTDFLFNMSHDIRTPMNAIMGFTSIAKKNLDDKARLLDSLDKTQEASSLLLSLINSILDMSRIESGKAVLEEIPCDVQYSFESIRSTSLELAAAKGIDLSFEMGEITDRFDYADIERCVRVLLNIITNAIKYTKDGGRVKVRCEQIGKREDGYGIYCYTCEDNGIGMSEDFQKYVFDQFTREENSTTRGIQGTGLGMAVVKAFVELMNGTVGFTSQKGVGTTFVVTLPFRIQENAGKLQYFDPDSGLPVVMDLDTEEKTEISGEGRRVLLVEDNDLNREIATDLLEEEHFTVETAEDGSIAVKKLRELGPEYYDVILMDIQMPVMGGYEAAETIRKMYPDARIPIIALSANAFAEDKAASLAAGMNDHIAKPINVTDLFNCLLKYL